MQGYRLSPQQRHLWSLQQDDPLSRYRVYCAVSVEGRIDLPLLRKILDDVCQRHEILRTSFHCLPGMTIPIQTINGEPMISIRDYDLSDLEPHEQPARIQSLVQEVKHASLDFAAGPVGHFSLAILSPAKCLLLASLSALCVDAAGLRSLVREISKLYEAGLAAARPSDEPLQYADISAWQNELFESGEAESGKEYWVQQNLSSHLALKLPLENKRAVQSHFEPASLRRTVSRELSQKIRICAGKYQVTEALFFLACWQVLLARLTGQSGIVIGVSYTGRNYPELEGTVGPLTRCLPIAGQLDSNKSFHQVLSDLKNVDDEVEKWQECFSWEQFVEANEALASSPFLPYSFEFADAPEPYRTSDLTFTIIEEAACDDRYRVKIVCQRERADLITEFQFDSDLFSLDQIRRLADQYQTLLESAVQTPEAAISEMEILPCGERQQLLVEFNRTETPYPHDRCFTQLFEEQVEKTPDSVALVFGDQAVTYKELNARANQLARYLRVHGVGPEVVVGICLNRSIEMVTGLLGILKAGGAYMPLDHSDPGERVGFMLKDVQANIVLTLHHLIDRLPATADGPTRLVCLDLHWESIARESGEKLAASSKPENLAYVIYTSGSTGKPKGVMLSHRGLVNYLSWCRRSYVTPFGQGAPVHSSLGFDLTVTSLFSPLLLGQTVFLLPDSQGVEALSNAFKSGNEFSLIKITPSHLELLEQSFTTEAARRIGALIIGGEALFAESLHFWRANAPHIRVINEYGPTEAVVGCCVYELLVNFEGAGPVPIGQPIANAQLYVLDERLQPVPVGVSGELYIGGAGLARGYLNRPELTAEKFIPHPFSSSQGERLYRTGDLARHLSDGQIEYQGRLDEQVKLRGYRIELDEIRATLKEDPAVQDSVVVLREDTPGDKRLVAYIVCNTDDPPATNHWREFLKTKLPDYMIPSAFIMLEELPLTANGKVARQALPASGGTTRARRFVAPRNAVEEQLSETWKAALHLESISMDDRFLELGGHSLLALRLLSRINQQFNSKLSLDVLLQAETIAEMAQLLNPATEQAAPWSPLVQLQSTDGGEAELPFFCVHPATGSPFAYVELARQLKRQFYGLQSRVVEPFTSIPEMAANYLQAVRAVQPSGPYLLGGWSMGGLVAYEMAVQLQTQGAAVGLVALMDRAALVDPPRDEPELRELFEAVVANVKEQVRASGNVTEFDSEKYRQYWQVFVSNYRATEAYRAPRYEGRVVLLTSEESRELAADETLGWSSLAAEVKVHHVPGSHNSMILPPNVEVVSEHLRDCIERAAKPTALNNEYEFSQTAYLH